MDLGDRHSRVGDNFLNDDYFVTGEHDDDFISLLIYSLFEGLGLGHI